MAHTCDHCRKSFPDTNAFFDHLGNCKAFKEAQSSSGDSKAMKCHLCPATFSERAKLARHFRDSHVVKKEMSEGEVLSEMEKRPKDPKGTCKYCGSDMLKRQLVTHYKTCKKAPKVKEAAAGATAFQDLNVSRDSLVGQAGNLDIREEPEIMSREQFLQGFQNYMKNPSQGNLSGETPRLYRDKIIHFLNFWKGQSQNFSAGKLVNFGSKINFIQLPHSEEWEGTLGSGSSRSQGLSAYIQLIRYLRFLNFKSLDQQKMDKREVYDRENHLNRMNFEAKLRNKNSKGKKAAGKGKAKTSKPGTSKEANKSPAKKKQRGAAAYSDSDSSQFSEEDSD